MWMCVFNATSELTFYYVNILEACMYKCTIRTIQYAFMLHSLLFEFFVLSTASLYMP